MYIVVIGNWPVQCRQVPWSDTTQDCSQHCLLYKFLQTTPSWGRLVWLSLAQHIVSLDKELYSTLSLFTQVYKRVPATYCWGVILCGLASHPGGSSNTPRHTKETTISSGHLGLWLMCAFTLNLIIKGDFWHCNVLDEQGQEPEAYTINWCYNPQNNVFWL